jgi:type IV pilus assembly protein PilP
MPSNQQKIVLFLTLLLTLLLISCRDSKGIQDLQVYIAKLRESVSHHQKKEVAPILQLPIGITYQATILRAPFAEQGAYAGPNRTIVNPLQEFSLNMLKFIGTLSMGQMITAFVLAPDNKVYQVNVGDSVGDRNGKVINIYQDRMEVREDSAGENARNTQRIITLQLKEQHS